MGSLDMESARTQAYSQRQQGCCRSCLRSLVRWFNYVVLVVGLAILGYGAYLAVVGKGIDLLSGSLLTVGLVDTIFPLLTVLCGLRFRWWLQCSIFFMGTVTLFEVVVACFFIIPGARHRISGVISEDHSKAGRLIEANLAAAGFALMAAAAVQIIALVFMYCQSGALVEDAGRAEDDAEQALEDAKDPLLKTEEGRSMTRSQRQAANASNKYKERNAHMYSKYNFGGAKK